jgi:dTDP-4-amino-4,6-dideoxygalactose transaminase
MLPFSPPNIDQAMIDEVVDALKSGWITTGPKMKALEKSVEDFTGVPKVLCLNSATAGMEIALRWLGVQPGDEVIVPAYTYTATASVVLHCGATPVMVDINQEDFTIDFEAIADAITPRTKAIMPVDIGGLPCNYEAIWNVIHDAKPLFQPRTEAQKTLGRIMLLADAAHSLGAMYQEEHAALHCDMACYSFHAVKNLTTAEGGAIALNMPIPFDNEAIYKEMYRTTLHGQTKDALAKTVGKNSWEYDVVEAGYKMNMPDVLAAIGLAGMRTYPEMLLRRRDICDLYTKLLSKYAWAETPIYEDNDRVSSYHLYMLRIRECDLEQRNEIIKRISDHEVTVNVHYKPLPLLTVYKNLGYEMEDYPIAEGEWQCEITLPLYVQLTEAQVAQVVKAVADSVAAVFSMQA